MSDDAPTTDEAPDDDFDDGFDPDDVLAGWEAEQAAREAEERERLEALPQLSALPRSRWIDALRPLDRQERSWAMGRLAREAGFEAVDQAQIALGALSMERPRRAQPVPVPTLPVRPARPQDRRRQVNLKLTDREHDALATAAELVALRPPQLARLLVARGVQELCREYER